MVNLSNHGRSPFDKSQGDRMQLCVLCITSAAFISRGDGGPSAGSPAANLASSTSRSAWKGLCAWGAGQPVAQRVHGLGGDVGGIGQMSYLQVLQDATHSGRSNIIPCGVHPPTGCALSPRAL